MSKELDLIEKKDLRENYIDRVDALEKVKDLLLLPGTEYATTEQVAEFYEVDFKAVETVASRHKDELESDGFQSFRKSNVIKMLNIQDECLENKPGKSIANVQNEHLEIPNRGLRLFPKRAILRVGMLLRDSEIAKEVRTRLLDIVHDTEEQSPEIIEGVTDEIAKEQQLCLDMGKAIRDGDVMALANASTELNKIKNERIQKLEDQNEKITTNSLTIIESRKVINRIVRNIATKEYNNLYGKAWGDFYSKINYKLGINVKSRNKSRKETYLDVLTEEETFKVEKIARNWAVKVGLDLDKLLKIA